MEYGLIGSKLVQSYSKIIQESIADYTYDLHPLPTEPEARAFLASRQFKAINVTIPYKRLVMEYCDEIDPAALAIGAVNTVVNRGGKLYGYNTDFGGVLYTLKAHDISLAGRKVLVLGTGGTHNTVCAVCKAEGAARVTTVSRSGGDGRVTYEEAMKMTDTEVIFNTTPAGMFPDNGTCLIDLSGFSALQTVVDVVYNPFKTALLLQAEKMGVKAVCGFEMLVGQAVLASEHFIDKKYPEGTIQQVHARLKRSLSNVSLIGMPSSGKSSVGQALAALLDKPFIDLDEEMVRRTGTTIADIFAKEGEAGFRAREAELVKEFGAQNGRVISCGGGVIKTPGNADALRQNGPVLWVRRPLDQLVVGGGRPLSTGREALARMEIERTPLYRAASDGIIENNTTLDEAVKAAGALFETLCQ